MTSNEYGVCRLSVVSVRANTSHLSEQVTQLLFGDHYEVLAYSKDKNWIKIKIDFDLYEGWIEASQHHPVSYEYFEYINRADFKITTDLSSSILYNKNSMPILIGSIIPISVAELFKMEEQFAFNGEAKNKGQKRDFAFLQNIALKYLNAPYQWGGKNPFGIDCSGFVQMVFKISGYSLMRDASQQAKQGKLIKLFNEVKRGDLVFFKNEDQRIKHVGIALADGKIIHASGRVRIDILTESGIINSTSNNLTHQLAFIKRILPEVS